MGADKMIFFEHVVISFFVALAIAETMMYFGLDLTSALVFIIVVVSVNFIDIDHYAGSIRDLIAGGLAIDELTILTCYPQLQRSLLHEIWFVRGVVLGFIGVVFGYFLHLKLDGVL